MKTAADAIRISVLGPLEVSDPAGRPVRVGGQALVRGDARDAVTLLGEALGAWRGSALADVADEEFAFAPAARWWERPTLATVLDACAVYAQARGEATDPELAARLLGAAAALRGAVDESSLDAPRARRSAIAALGEERFHRAYDAELAITYESAIALARQACQA